MLDARKLVAQGHDILLITLDTLRYDVAYEMAKRGETPNLCRILPGGVWEKRHSPGSFTYAAHMAFFAGFLPTPRGPGRHDRLFAVRFPGSATVSEQTMVLDGPDLVAGLAACGYHTVCIGGVSFFDRRTPLGSVLPSLFAESHWSEQLAVTERHSTRHQVALAVERVAATAARQRLFLFLNVSAIHSPNRLYLPSVQRDCIASHAAALRYVDGELPPLFEALARRAPVLCIICSDHGTAYGEDGYLGHRIGHRVVWTVPYAELVLPKRE